MLNFTILSSTAPVWPPSPLVFLFTMTNLSSLAAGTAAVLAVTFVDSPQVLETTDGLVKFVSVSHPDSDRHPGMIQYLSKHNAIVGKISNISDDFRSKIRGINAVSVSPPHV